MALIRRSGLLGMFSRRRDLPAWLAAGTSRLFGVWVGWVAAGESLGLSGCLSLVGFCHDCTRGLALRRAGRPSRRWFR